MDYTDRLENHSSQMHGTMISNGEERLSEAAEKNQMELMKLAYQVAVEKFSMTQPAGIVFWSGRKHTPSVHLGGNGIVVIWTHFNKKSYIVRTIDSGQTWSVNKITGDSSWNTKCGFLLYSYMKISEDPGDMLSKTSRRQEEDFQECYPRRGWKFTDEVRKFFQRGRSSEPSRSRSSRDGQRPRESPREYRSSGSQTP